MYAGRSGHTAAGISIQRILRYRDRRQETRDLVDVRRSEPESGTRSVNVEESALRFVKESVKNERALSRTRDSGDGSYSAIDRYRDIAEIVFPSAADLDLYCPSRSYSAIRCTFGSLRPPGT